MNLVAKKEITVLNTDSHKVFFPNLDGLRFFAFFLVYLQHGFGGAVALNENHNFFLVAVKNAVFASGWAGVSFFFVLSGFLITYLILTEISLTGKIDVGAFYVRRVLRIWPLYYLVLLFAFVMYPVGKSLISLSTYIEAGNPLYYIFFLSNFDVINLGQGHGAMSTNITWSVAIEEQFYLCWPLLFFILPRRSYKYTFILIILGSAFFRFRHIDDGMILYFHSLSVISDMAVGGLCAYCAKSSQNFRQFWFNLPRWAISILYCLGFGLMIFRQQIFVTSLLVVIERLACSLFFAFIVLEQNYCDYSFIKMKNFRHISALGIYTYGLYLLHPIAILLLQIPIKMTVAGEPSLMIKLSIGGVGLLLSIAMSYLSYEYFEKKFLSLKKKFTHVLSEQSPIEQLQKAPQEIAVR